MKKILAILMCVFALGAFAQNSVTPATYDHNVDFERVSEEIMTADEYTVTGVNILVFDIGTEVDFPVSSDNVIENETVYSLASQIQPQTSTDSDGTEITTPIQAPTFYQTIEGYVPPAMELNQSMDQYLETLALHSEETGYNYVAWFSGGTASGQAIGTFEVRNMTSVEPINNNEKLAMYPNPTTGIVTLSGLPEGNHSLWIYDLKGKQITERTITNNNFVDLSDLGSGMYVSTVVINGETETKQFVIQK